MQHFDEFPIATIPTTPLWSENYCLTCFDPATGVSVMVFLGRWWANPKIWREQILIGLPGGRVISARQHGSAATSEIASAALMKIEFPVPGRQLILSYEGPATEYGYEELITQGAAFKRLQPLKLKISFDAVTPIWDMTGHADGGATMVGALHLEQIGHGNGFVEFNGERHTVTNAFMNRDHSRGVRDLRPYRRHCWAQGWFPGDELSFSVFGIEAFGHQGLAMSNASVSEGDRRYSAEITNVELIVDQGCALKPYRFTVRSELGDWHIASRPTGTNLQISSPIYWEPQAGIIPGVSHMTVVEEPVIWDRDIGESGIGWSERGFILTPFTV